MGELLAAGVPWDAATTLTPPEAEILVLAIAANRGEQ